MRSIGINPSRPFRRSMRCSRPMNTPRRDSTSRCSVRLPCSGVVLAIVGVYGVMSSAVAQQTPEIGVRMALGASSADILRMVVGRGSRLLLIGMALGLIGSVASGAIPGAADLERAGLRSAGVRRLFRWRCSWRDFRRASGRPAGHRGSIRSSRCGRTSARARRAMSRALAGCARRA